jgi:hypothetical protein
MARRRHFKTGLQEHTLTCTNSHSICAMSNWQLQRSVNAWFDRYEPSSDSLDIYYDDLTRPYLRIINYINQPQRVICDVKNLQCLCSDDGGSEMDDSENGSIISRSIGRIANSTSPRPTDARSTTARTEFNAQNPKDVLSLGREQR